MHPQSILPGNPIINEMIDEFFGNVFNDKKIDQKYPLTDVYHDEDGFHIEIAVAGFSKDDIDVKIEDNVLVVSASKEKEVENENRRYFKKDIAKRSFIKKYKLLTEISDVDAEIKNGILYILLKEKEPELNTKQIEIKN